MDSSVSPKDEIWFLRCAITFQLVSTIKCYQKKLSQTDLCWQHYQSDAYHDNHVQLRGPYVGDEVAVSDCGEGDDHEVGGLEQVQMPMTGSLEVLNTTNTAQTNTQGTVSSKGLCR